MKRALAASAAVAALAAVLLTGCRGGAQVANGTNHTGPAGTSSSVNATTGANTSNGANTGGATTSKGGTDPAGVNNQLDSVDTTLDQIDDHVKKANQPPTDKD